MLFDERPQHIVAVCGASFFRDVLKPTRIRHINFHLYVDFQDVAHCFANESFKLIEHDVLGQATDSQMKMQVLAATLAFKYRQVL